MLYPPGAVAQDQRRGSNLAVVVAALEEAGEIVRPRRASRRAAPAHGVGDVGERRVERLAEPRDRRWQRIGEVGVVALAEAVAAHADPAAVARSSSSKAPASSTISASSSTGRRGVAAPIEVVEQLSGAIARSPVTTGPSRAP